MAYGIQFTKSAEEHFADLTARQQAIVLNAMRPNPLAPWELRVGFLRVFYEVDALESDLVNVLAIGIKKGNKLFVSGKEIQI